jgi:energy-coupling factor transporter transmembrane protein EcfT
MNIHTPDPSLKSWARDLMPVGLFALLYTIAAIVVSAGRSNGEFMIYIGVLIVIFCFVAFLHWRIKLQTSSLWALALWGFWHMAGGLVPVPQSWPIEGDIRVLYSWWIIPDTLKYDHVIHAYGFGVTTWVCWQGMRAAVRPYGQLRPTFGVLVLCVTAGMGFGALNEVVEFAATLSVPETNVGGYINTGWDLVSNLVGSITAALLIRLFACREAHS